MISGSVQSVRLPTPFAETVKYLHLIGESGAAEIPANLDVAVFDPLGVSRNNMEGKSRRRGDQSHWLGIDVNGVGKDARRQKSDCNRHGRRFR
jgi:hypothetical protein